jgi:hypothetical protein
MGGDTGAPAGVLVALAGGVTKTRRTGGIVTALVLTLPSALVLATPKKPLRAGGIMTAGRGGCGIPCTGIAGAGKRTGAGNGWAMPGTGVTGTVMVGKRGLSVLTVMFWPAVAVKSWGKFTART